MRVAVHAPDGTVFAYRLGRIEDGVHNHYLHSGETVPLEDFVGGLVRQAREEYPDHEVRVERLVRHPENADEAQWIDAEEFDPEVHTPQGAGGQRSASFEVSSEQVSG